MPSIYLHYLPYFPTPCVSDVTPGEGPSSAGQRRIHAGGPVFLATGDGVCHADRDHRARHGSLRISGGHDSGRSWV